MRTETIKYNEEPRVKDYYRNSSGHLFDELRRIDGLVREQAALYSQSCRNNGNMAFKGLCITGEEIGNILERTRSAKPGRGRLSNDYKEDIDKNRADMDRKIKNSRDKQIYLPLVHLCSLFSLSPLERDVLMVCMAPELVEGYGTCFAYLQDDVTQRQPTVALILRLLSIGFAETAGPGGCFSRHSPLFKYQLVHFTLDSGHKPLLSRALKADDRIVEFLLETPSADSRVNRFCRLIQPRRDWSGVFLPETMKKTLMGLSREFSNNKRPPMVFYFSGPAGSGRKSTAKAFCREPGMSLIVVDTPGLLENETGNESLLGLIYREAMLHGAALYFDRFEALTGGSNRFREFFMNLAGAYSTVTFFSGSIAPPISSWPCSQRLPFLPFEFPVPSYALRKQLWAFFLGKGTAGPFPRPDTDALANTFQLTGGRIRDAVQHARAQTQIKEKEMTVQDLYQACREQSSKGLGEKARKIYPLYCWSDIILPPDTLQQLKEIVLHMTHRGRVFFQWGFEQKLSYGKGLNILFYGPSGTGKTMSAEVIAGELGIDLYKIDLSRIISKYIGETEKNLGAIFKEAETANSILFFDEADALFGKRSEVKDSHDRYANIETGYLLQKMEEYEGVVILATNMRKNMDDAFIRRMNFTISFPFPDEEARLRIWRAIFPTDTPVDPQVDLKFLADRFNIPGGNIKNIALAAAFYAAADQTAITMRHLIKATKREFGKMGKLCLKEDFGKYYDII